MRAFFLIMLGVSLLFSSNFFVDKKTGLIWQDNSAVKEIKMNWQDAVNYCSELNLGGYRDWRLPDIKELQSIVNISKYKPAIKKGFKYVDPWRAYWSSSVYISDTSKAWRVRFETGETQSSSKKTKYHVRCIRNNKK